MRRGLALGASARNAGSPPLPPAAAGDGGSVAGTTSAASEALVPADASDAASDASDASAAMSMAGTGRRQLLVPRRAAATAGRLWLLFLPR